MCVILILLRSTVVGKEIELKFKINEEIKKTIIKDLEGYAKKKGESHLVDTYYTPYFKEYEIDGVTQECVRIRENEKGNILCYKKIHYEANPIYCDEYETKVENKDQMEKFLFALGFSVQMVIDKTRVTYKLDNFEFDFDSVKNLGELMEVELTEGDNVDEIYNFVKKYGLTQNDVTHEGIQVLMKKAMNKNN